MKISVITPTVQRDSLLKTCDSVNEQFGDWEHIVMIDSPTIKEDLIEKIRHPRRTIAQCAISHRNGGNTCRHNAYAYTTGDWLIHLDDDNFFPDPVIIADLAHELETIGEWWAIFPILRHGLPFYFDPPIPNYFDTANAVVRREIGRWPDIDDYASDGVWVNALREKYPYRAFPNFRPIVVMPTSSFGAGGGINGQ